ncbi:MAG: D-lactate dehydrogenase [Pseudomonadota bacterium]
MANSELIAELQRIVGSKHVITNAKSMKRFCKGYRSGEGEAIAVVRPGTLLEQWKTVQACAAADKIIIMQAANTGLTEGSTPKDTYDREVVILNTMRMSQIQLIRDGKQIVSFPGATLFALEQLLRPLGRQPHSVIGSSTIGASIVGGVCNNAGGSLCERGPSYTELALYAEIKEDGQVELVNHLGIDLGDDPETILTRLEHGDYTEEQVEDTNRKASDTNYPQWIRDVDADTPSRYNGDATRLYGISGCAGKRLVFAARLDTYATYEREQVFYLGTTDTTVLTKLRRDFLKTFKTLPVSGEYMHTEAYAFTKVYGKDTLVLIDKLGTDRLPKLFAIKGWLDARLNKLPLLPKNMIDRILQGISYLWPNPLMTRMEEFHDRFPHHLILKMHDDGIEEAEAYLKEHMDGTVSDWFACTPREAKVASLHRFAAAGVPVRYAAVNPEKVSDILALDIALRRNDTDWFEVLPDEIAEGISHKVYYGHFFCHVMHQDYVIKKGYDPKEIKAEMLKILDKRRAQYPSEHNVGHIYHASEDQKAFFKACDPTNSLNPGIGKMSKQKHYA